MFPAGSFEEKGSRCEYNGVIDGADVNVVIKQLDFDTFDFVVSASGLDFFYVDDPAEIIITIGLDCFSTQVKI